MTLFMHITVVTRIVLGNLRLCAQMVHIETSWCSWSRLLNPIPFFTQPTSPTMKGEFYKMLSGFCGMMDANEFDF